MKISDAANVKTFIAFHHDPGHNDAFMDAVGVDLAEARPGSLVARENMEIDLCSGEVEVGEPSSS